MSSKRRIGRPTGVWGSKDDERCAGTRDATQMRKPSPVLKRLAYQMTAYPLMYMLIWTIRTAIRIYQSVTGKPAPFGIATVDKVCSLPNPRTFGLDGLCNRLV